MGGSGRTLYTGAYNNQLPFLFFLHATPYHLCATCLRILLLPRLPTAHRSTNQSHRFEGPVP